METLKHWKRGYLGGCLNEGMGSHVQSDIKNFVLNTLVTHDGDTLRGAPLTNKKVLGVGNVGIIMGEGLDDLLSLFIRLDHSKCVHEVLYWDIVVGKVVVGV